MIKQITDRAVAGRPHLSALDDMLDRLEDDRKRAAAAITEAFDAPADVTTQLVKLQEQVTPQRVRIITNTLLYYARDHADAATRQPFVDVVRQLVQKVVITATPGHQPPKLEVHGLIASILAAMEAASIMEERFRLLKRHEYLEKLEGGELADEEAQKKLLDAYAEELSVKRLEWANIQVWLVAGAGFEPAAFRL
jgi:hypothetical protein